MIQSESAVAAGVRRIEALTGRAAEMHLNEQRDQLRQVRELFKNPRDLGKALEQLQAENQSLRKEVEATEQRRYTAIAADLAGKVEHLNGTRYLGVHADEVPMDGLKKIATELKGKGIADLIVLVAAFQGKASVLIQIEEATAVRLGLDAGKLIKEVVAPLIKGGGGGQKLLATAGGQDASQLREVLVALRERV